MTEPDFEAPRTAEQLAASFRAMLRPIEDEPVDQPDKDTTRVQHADDSLGFYLQEYQDAGGVSERWVKL